MRKKISMSFIVLVVAATALSVPLAMVSCSKSDSTTNPTASGSPTVHSMSVTARPVIDGNGNDATWNAAQWLTVHMKEISGTNAPAKQFDVQIKSVHTADSIYFLVTYPDAVPNEVPNKMMFNGGSPTNKSSWTNSYSGQDGFSFMWDMMYNGNAAYDVGGKFTDSSYGCQAACHTTTSPSQLESGMFPLNGAVDIWYWNAGTTNPHGLADDQCAVGADNLNAVNPSCRFKDSYQEQSLALPNYGPSSPNFPDNVSGATNNNLDKNKFLWGNTSVVVNTVNPATGNPWVAGDSVPGWSLLLPKNVNGEEDVHAKGVYANGGWTIEFVRTLIASDTDVDVSFTPAKTSYPFSISVHENVRKYTGWEYSALGNYEPPHYGCLPRKLNLSIE